MILDAILQYLHISAILAVVVFISSATALCRSEWLNPAAVRRLALVNAIYGWASLAVLATGVLRTWLGPKGLAWYGANWLLWTKVAAFAAVGLLSIRSTRALARWRAAVEAGGALPAAAEVAQVRRWLMQQAHIIPLIPLAAVFLARGWGGLGG